MVTVIVGNVTVNIAQNELPFGNVFAAINARIADGYLKLQAHCTRNSKEPGRVYSCAYSLDGELLACKSLN